MKLFGMYGTQMTFKACGLLVASTCMVSILFVFCLDSRLFNFVWSPGKRVSCISSLWLLVTLLYIWVEYFFLPLHYHLLFTKLSTNIFCILQVISISFILSTVEHWDTFIFALFVRKTCTLYDMVLKRHKMNSPNFKVYSTI